MANNQENEDFSQDVKDEQQSQNGEKLAAGENGTENGSEQNGQNEESIGENGGQANEAAARDDDRLARTFHIRIAHSIYFMPVPFCSYTYAYLQFINNRHTELSFDIIFA